MANTTIAHRRDKVKYINRILANSEEKALEVLHRTEMPPFIPGLDMVSITDVARFFGVSTSTISSAVQSLAISAKSDRGVTKLITSKEVPDISGFKCVCEADSVKDLRRYLTLRYEQAGTCVTAHVPRCSRFMVFTARAILLISLTCGHNYPCTKDTSRVLTDEIIRTYTEDSAPVTALALPTPAVKAELPTPAEVLTPEVIEPETKHVELEIPTPMLVESIPTKISLQVSDDKTFVVPQELFEFMVRSCANIIISR